MRKVWRVFLAVALLFLWTAEACAHSPIFLAGRLPPGVHERAPIRDVERSWAVYGRLGPGASADLIPLTVEKGQEIYLQLLIPQAGDPAQVCPKAVLIGPGLPNRQYVTDTTVTQALAQLAAQTEGTLVLPNSKAKESLYEGFTQVRYWVCGEFTAKAPASAAYRLFLYDPSARGGPYTLAIGRREQFGLVDFLTFPLIWTRVHVWLWK
ncbi:MAG: hypothetical protein ACM3XM_01120 [Mycobacterium leprae]